MSDHLSDPPPYEPPPQEEDFYEWETEDEGDRPGILWFRIVALIVGLLLVFFFGRVTAGGGDEVDESELQSLRQENAQLEDEVGRLQTDLDDAQAVPEPEPTDDGAADDTGGEDTGEDDSQETATESYTVQSGDSFQLIAENEYSDVGLADCIAEANGLTIESTIVPGDVLELPAAESC